VNVLKTMRNINTSLPLVVSKDIKNGHVLAGDDLQGEALSNWYAQEEEAFAGKDISLSLTDTDPWYAYMRYVNNKLIFNRLGQLFGDCGSILFVGPGNGKEAEIISQLYPNWAIYFLEASADLRKSLKKKFAASVILKPNTNGTILLDDGSIDVVCAFSVLHHIANVSAHLAEFERILANRGRIFVREPCSSMGDWTKVRKTTPNERGISKYFFLHTALKLNLEPATPPRAIFFEPLNKLAHRLSLWHAMNFKTVFKLDILISKVFSFNDHYWRDTTLKKLGPSTYLYEFVRRS